MDGILIVNKHLNVTSHDIVYKVKKMLNEKVGHTGTLDPMAEGVLPLLIGKGTNCAKYLINHDKKYLATVKLGEKMDTADSEGTVIEEKEVDVSLLKNIEEVLNKMQGEQMQVPPMYSAIKVNGKKLYEYARKGETVEVKARKINIYETKLINIDEEKLEITFEVKVSKGTYIRTVCEEFAKMLDTVGYMKALTRLEVGEFSIEDAIRLEMLEQNKEKSSCLDKHFISIEEFFSNKDFIDLEEKTLELFLNGVKLTSKKEDGIYRIYSSGKFIGIGIIDNHLLKRDIVI